MHYARRCHQWLVQRLAGAGGHPVDDSRPHTQGRTQDKRGAVTEKLLCFYGCFKCLLTATRNAYRQGSTLFPFAYPFTSPKLVRNVLAPQQGLPRARRHGASTVLLTLSPPINNPSHDELATTDGASQRVAGRRCGAWPVFLLVPGFRWRRGVYALESQRSGAVV